MFVESIIVATVFLLFVLNKMGSDSCFGIGKLVRSVLDLIGLKCPGCEDTDVLFFPDTKLPCNTFYAQLMNKPKQTCYNKKCLFFHDRPGQKGKSDLVKLYKILDKAQNRLDLCVYLFTEDKLFDFIEYLHSKRGVKIRILTDAGTDQDVKVNNKASKLQDIGIEVKMNVQKTDSKFKGKMHNKFVIIDEKTMIFGSFNWTINAILNNDESLVITSQEKLVEKFVDKFDDLWAKAEIFKIQEPTSAPTTNGSTD